MPDEDRSTKRSPASRTARRQIVTTATPAGEGTQAIRRATALLRELAKAGTDGGTLTAMARETALPRSTAHRILQCLLDEGLVARSASDDRYRMGPLIHELGLTSSSSLGDIAQWAPIVEAVARRTGVTSYLMRRSGVEAVCLIKVDGSSMLRFVPVEVGQRRLLGVGAGATALLAGLEPRDRDQLIETIAPGLARYPRLDADSVRAAVRLVERSGFAISQGTVVDDGFGMGLAVPEANAAPRLALSIAAHATEVTESRISAWRRVLAASVAEGVSRAS